MNTVDLNFESMDKLCGDIHALINDMELTDTMIKENPEEPTYFIHFLPGEIMERYGYTRWTAIRRPLTSDDLSRILLSTVVEFEDVLWTDCLAGKTIEECMLKWIACLFDIQCRGTTDQRKGYSGSCILFEMMNKEYYRDNNVVVTNVVSVSEELSQHGLTCNYSESDTYLGITPDEGEGGFPYFHQVSKSHSRYHPIYGEIFAACKGAIRLLTANGIPCPSLDAFREISTIRPLELKFSVPQGLIKGEKAATFFNWSKVKQEYPDQNNIAARESYQGPGIDAYVFTSDAYAAAQVTPIMCIDVITAAAGGGVRKRKKTKQKKRKKKKRKKTKRRRR